MKNNASLVYNICLIIGDALAITVAFTIAYILRVTLNHTPLSADVHAHTYIGILTGLLPFWILIFGLLGLYNHRIYEKRFTELGRLLVGSFIGILFVISYSYMTNTVIFPARLVTIYGFALAFVCALLFRTLARGIRRELFGYGLGINNVLLVGDTKTTHRLIESLKDSAVSGYKVVGVVGGVKHPLKANTPYTQYKNFAVAVGHLRNRQLHTIIQTELYSNGEQNDEILTYAQEKHVAYRFVPGNSELFVGKIEVDLFQSVPIIAVHQTPLIGWGRVVKRLTDVIVGGLFLLIASPFMLLIAVAIKLSDWGPVVFRQERLTRFDTKVLIFKFRTLKARYNGLSPEEAFAKMDRLDLLRAYRANNDWLANDPRLTALGRFLRLYSLDELPQLFNVFRGDIALVGPRALVALELDKYAQKNLILSVKSGLTGLAQISGVNDLTFEERRQLDLFYVQNWSFWSDMVILAKTFWVVLFHKGARG
ncbi:MAG TPA: sugar transferase [Candidatus Saccharimonadales bacterium]|jgi:exopolysaccharide biosynthesis polyprenyl glycosylphosphotransferase|nr:sugar transferase [Candidatus Saccharimonadales bacterium]